jgi:hypothetical protein
MKALRAFLRVKLFANHELSHQEASNVIAFFDPIFLKLE